MPLTFCVVLFRTVLSMAKRRRQLVGIYVLCMHARKEPQKPPEHTSERAKVSQCTIPTT